MDSNVICIGDAVMDIFLTVDEKNPHYSTNGLNLCFRLGDKVPVDACSFLLGGNACNVSVGLSRMGFKSKVCIEIGDDEFAIKILGALTKEKVDTSNVLQTKGTYSSFAFAINFKRERILFVEHIKRDHDFSLAGGPKFVYLTSMGKDWEGAYKKVYDFVVSNSLPLAFNPGTLQLSENNELIKELLKITTILFVNKEEAERLAGEVQSSKFKVQNEGNQEIIKELLKQLKTIGSKIVVITDGRNGSYTIDEDGKMLFLEMFPGEPVERTGAGDAYASGFLSAILTDFTVDEAMRWGTVNAGSVVKKIGAETGLLGKEEMERVLSEHKEFRAKEI